MVLALAHDAPPLLKSAIEELQTKMRNLFFDLRISQPAPAATGKGITAASEAINQAIEDAAGFFQSREINFPCVIVSFFDRPRTLNPSYFTCLTYNYMVRPDRTHVVFQPAPVYSEKFLSEPLRLRAFEAAFLFLESAQAWYPMKLQASLGCAMSLKLLVEAGFLPEELFSYAEGFSWKAFIQHKGFFQVILLYVSFWIDEPIRADSRTSLLELYKRKHNTAWGIETFPILARALLKSRDMPLVKKAGLFIILLESLILSAVWPFLLSLVGWLPLLFLSREFTNTAYYFSVPRISAFIIFLSLTGFAIACMACVSLQPKAKKKDPKQLKQLLLDFPQWAAVTIAAFFLGSLESLFVQTRMMLGAYYLSSIKKR